MANQNIIQHTARQKIPHQIAKRIKPSRADNRYQIYYYHRKMWAFGLSSYRFEMIFHGGSRPDQTKAPTKIYEIKMNLLWRFYCALIRHKWMLRNPFFVFWLFGVSCFDGSVAGELFDVREVILLCNVYAGHGMQAYVAWRRGTDIYWCSGRFHSSPFFIYLFYRV